MTIENPIHREFQRGDEVELAEGTYQGTSGVFLRLRQDPNWADITESNGAVRSHPVAWLALAAAQAKTRFLNDRGREA